MLRIEEAGPADDEAVAQLIHGFPSPEVVGIAGGRERGIELGLALFRAGVGRTPHDETHLAWLSGEPVGVLLARSAGGSLPVPTRAIPALVRAVLRLYPPHELPGLIRRVRMRARLDFPVPPGSLHLAELHVDPRYRGRSIGSALLAHAERRATELGCRRLNLTTATSNPARRLYGRMGFELVHERTVPGYEAMTGSSGRVFLEKRLSGAGR